MLRLKSRSVLCTPSSGLSRALRTLNVATPNARANDDDDDDDDDDGRRDDDAMDDDDDAMDGERRARDDDDARDARSGGTRASASADEDGTNKSFDFAGCSQSQRDERRGATRGGAGGTARSQGNGESQEFGGPDFITPADAQFDAYGGYEDKENFRGARSPCALSPARNKRPRFGLDLGASQGTQEFASQPLDATQPSQSQGEFGGGFRVPRNREPTRGVGSRSGLPRAATSPPCARNAFLPDDEQPPETSAHARRANCTSAAQLATMSRFRADFVDLGCIARGGFSKVHKVIGRLDGCRYALKRTDKKLQTERERAEALREVQVLASLTQCAEIVRYQSAWWENDHLYIQMELCDGSASKMVDSQSGERASEAALMRCLLDVSAALSYAHARGLAHMDIKPDNIFIHNQGYKLGDWGRVALLNGDRRDAAVDEGDARYLSSEVLNDDFSALDRADIFSLGASIYELALGASLPSHGAEYQSLRRGVVPRVDVPARVHAFVLDAMSPTPSARPTAGRLHARVRAALDEFA
jgi:wee1-like protein kinase